MVTKVVLQQRNTEKMLEEIVLDHETLSSLNETIPSISGYCSNKNYNRRLKRSTDKGEDGSIDKSSRFEIIYNNNAYDLDSTEKYRHEYGKGGNSVDHETLYDNKSKLVEFARTFSWATLSDDSEDYGRGTVLIRRYSDDPLAIEYLDRIKEIRDSPNNYKLKNKK